MPDPNIDLLVAAAEALSGYFVEEGDRLGRVRVLVDRMRRIASP